MAGPREPGPASTRTARSGRTVRQRRRNTRRCRPWGLTRNTEGEDEMDRRMDRRTMAKGAVPSRVRPRWDCFRRAPRQVERRRRLLRNRVCTTGWAATSGSPWSSTASAIRSSETRYSTRTPRQSVEQDAGGSAAAGSQVRSHAVDRGSRRRTLCVHRLAAQRGSRRVQSHGRTVRRGWGGDRARPRLLRGTGTRAAGTCGGLQSQHVRRRDGTRVKTPGTSPVGCGSGQAVLEIELRGRC